MALAGVRRVSTGTALTRVAFTALGDAARELLEQGNSSYTESTMRFGEITAAFDS